MFRAVFRAVFWVVFRLAGMLLTHGRAGSIAWTVGTTSGLTVGIPAGIPDGLRLSLLPLAPQQSWQQPQLREVAPTPQGRQWSESSFPFIVLVLRVFVVLSTDFVSGIATQ